MNKIKTHTCHKCGTMVGDVRFEDGSRIDISRRVKVIALTAPLIIGGEPIARIVEGYWPHGLDCKTIAESKKSQPVDAPTPLLVVAK